MSDELRQVGGGFFRVPGPLLAPSFNTFPAGLPSTVGPGGTATLDLNSGSYLIVVASGDFTLANPITPRLPGNAGVGGGGTPARFLMLQISSSAAVPLTITFGSEWHFNGAWPALGAGLIVTSMWIMFWNGAGLVKQMNLAGRDNDQA